jgi:hypothetical protein
MPISVTWPATEQRLKAVAEASEPLPPSPADEVLAALGMIDDGELTPLGERYWMARYVAVDPAETHTSLADALKHLPSTNAFCEALWRASSLPVDGSMNLLRRLERGYSDDERKRFIELLGRAGLIVYNRKNPRIRAVYNPLEILPPEEQSARERNSAHLISPDTPFGNLLALRQMIRSSRSYICWYEQHMPRKVLEVLYRELDGVAVSNVRILSGPATVDAALNGDFKRFAKELHSLRQIDVEWRVLSRREAADHHGRFFLSDGIMRNIPPLNTILKGSTDEILPSEVGVSEFDAWWVKGTKLEDAAITDQAAAA